MRGSRAKARLALACLACALAIGMACAQPLPPARPRDLDASPGQSQRPPPPAPEEETHPLKRMEHGELRQRMTICAALWSAKKQKGETTGLLWSDFSRACLEQK